MNSLLMVLLGVLASIPVQCPAFARNPIAESDRAPDLLLRTKGYQHQLIEPLGDQFSEGFFLFQLLADGDDAMNLGMRTYAVNQATGDVWMTMGAYCVLVTNRELKRLQLEMEKNSRIGPKEFAKLKRRKPVMCDN